MSAVQQEKNGRVRILAAARTLFDNHGFHQTAMAELAVTAQVSVGQIYRLFRSKEDIIEALVLDDADQWCAEMEDVQARLDSGELTVEATFKQLFIHTIDEKDEALSFDILAESFRNPAVADTIGAMCQRFRTYIRYFACAANDKLSGEALDAAEEMILACLFGLGHRSISRPRLPASSAAHWTAQMIVTALRKV
ncbi:MULTISPECIES: TetR/AcrR family transcriptional regulator [Sphingobium]|uniref:Transcriptional regulator n=2 Tax=Sphingobium cupriresistens TaxID=1132417 RepID=A0A0J7Y3D2_9SPHN|nr:MULTISPECIES: TetR/AcrR family transcriptional regulator [Sphingobium]KMS57933.1 transcriptional regulator [Sphingobium cupriresistens LL01]MBJ7377186.1 TetR/AcrR family transcriptional regulator [Sphingobium sp.]RYM12575.1 TetR/AcrR family transcriptional regulator [Sphingobium cupriresistens]